MSAAEFRQLAEAWRGKAARLRQVFQGPHPEAQSATVAALALETCAEDLERWAASDTPLEAALKAREP